MALRHIWIYKTGSKENPAQVRAKRWVNTLMEVKKNVDDPQDFIEIVKTGLVPNEIYVFTPKGDIIELPKRLYTNRFCFCSSLGCRHSL